MCIRDRIGTPGDLARLLDATISTVRGADVKAWDDWGIIVNGSYTNDSDHTAYEMCIRDRLT